MAKNIEIDKLSKKALVLLVKICYEEFNRGDSIDSFDIYDLSGAIKKMGFQTSSNKDTTFVYELLKLNRKKLEENSLTAENIILPGLKEVKIDYYRTVNETITYYYDVELETYSNDRKILSNYFNYDGDDSVDLYYREPYDKNYGESETHDEGIQSID
jgi:hypothetical protein